jgi:hypothetical protein
MIILANQLRHALGLKEGEHIGKLVMHGTWRELLRIAEEGSQTQQILPFHLIQKSFAAGFLEISQGDDVPHPCLSLPTELDLFKEVVYCGPNFQARVVFDGIGNNESRCECIQLSLLANATVVSSGCISTN